MSDGVAKLDGCITAFSWLDAHFNSDEVSGEDTVHRPWVYVTVGILVRSDEHGVTVAQDEGEDGRYRGRTFVPRQMIVEEWVVGPVKRKTRKRKAARLQQGEAA